MIRVHLLSPESPFHETANLDDASPPPESWVTFPWDSSPWWYESTSWVLSHLSMRQLTLMMRVHPLSPESPFYETAHLDDTSPSPESWVTFARDSSPGWYKSTPWVTFARVLLTASHLTQPVSCIKIQVFGYILGIFGETRPFQWNFQRIGLMWRVQIFKKIIPKI